MKDHIITPVVVLLLLCHFLPTTLQAQNTPPYQPMAIENAHWQIIEDNFEINIWPVDRHYEYLAKGDTTIGDYTYKKIYRRDFAFESDCGSCYPDYEYPLRVASSELVAVMRDDTLERKVYTIKFESHDYCYEEQEYLLYDFSVEEGDIFYNCKGEYVDSIRLKEVSTDNMTMEPLMTIHTFGGTYTEKIGGNGGLFAGPLPAPLSGWTQYLASYCVGDDYSCGLNTSITPKQLVPTFQLYSNPSTNILEWELTEALQQITISNLLGQTVMTQPINRQSINQVNVQHLQTGIYFLQLETTKGELLTQKFIR